MTAKKNPTCCKRDEQVIKLKNKVFCRFHQFDILFKLLQRSLSALSLSCMTNGRFTLGSITTNTKRERKKNHKNNDGLNDNNNYDKTYAGAHERVEMKAMA